MRKRSGCGVTLGELLLIPATIAMLIALLLPTIQRVRETACRLNCTSNMKHLALTVHPATGKCRCQPCAPPRLRPLSLCILQPCSFRLSCPV
jgi:Tfp pilus assembly protein FimT